MMKLTWAGAEALAGLRNNDRGVYLSGAEGLRRREEIIAILREKNGADDRRVCDRRDVHIRLAGILPDGTRLANRYPKDENRPVIYYPDERDPGDFKNRRAAIRYIGWLPCCNRLYKEGRGVDAAGNVIWKIHTAEEIAAWAVKCKSIFPCADRRCQGLDWAGPP